MSQQEVLCPACRGGNSPGYVFCQWCGHRRAEAYRVQQQPAQQVRQSSDGMPCLGTTLVVLGVLGIVGSFLFTFTLLSVASVFEAQSYILLGIMLVAGSFLLFMLPGILLLRKR